ncbi:zinc finger protein 397-like isoform X2 [Sphaerodactylus townsendi]|uniref:zinc finger protein 397-like isoform X2 n=1 Tax=Sphaerodactylus townsendi TaxID=933632 RepID=UPI00202695CC|nr:zinc finger protein 397-like isoform X2 [Sphaerodactylus townsendi]
MQNPTGHKLQEVSQEQGKSTRVLRTGTTDEFLQRTPEDLIHQKAGESSLSLEQWEAQWQEFLSTMENPHFGCGVPQLPEKPSPWGNARAFLASFEQVAEACWWPRNEWVIRLLPALSKEAAKAFNNLSAKHKEDYGKVKAAILREDALSQEKQRQQFRCFCYQVAEGPRGAYSRLQKMCRGWLRVENHSKEQILELLILEQLLSILPPEIQSWVREHGPESCSQAVALAEEFILRQNKQVVAGSISEAGHDHSEREQRHPSMDIKEEEDRKASLLGNVEEKVGESLGLSWEKVKEEEPGGNIKNPDGPDQQEGNHEVENMDQSISCQAESFGELLVQQDKPTKKQRDKCHSVGERIHTGVKQSKSVVSGNCLVERTETSILYQARDFSKIPGQEEMPAQMRNNQDRIHKAKKQYEKTAFVGNSSIETKNHTSDHRIHTEENQNECPECGVTFSNAANFNIHLQMHSGEKPFQCFKCEKSFRQKSYLRDHQRSHRGERPHSCSECEKSFFFKSRLVRHQTIHLEDKGFKYSECGKNWSQKTKLASHQRIHMLEDLYKCLECGLNFSDQIQFTEHLRMHHEKKPHRCSECGKSFLYRAHLLRHQRIHTGEKPYNCSECGKSFSTKSYLVIHQRIHSGEKPYKCSECAKLFRTRDKLNVHHRSHTGEKPYMCFECGKKFSQKKHLRRHQTIHTREFL